MNSLSVSGVKFFYESRGVDTRGFNIERPKEGELISGDSFLVGGWVVGIVSPSIEVNLLLSEVVVAVGLVDIDRPDVAKAFPAVEDAKSSGFRMEIPVVSLQGASELNLIAKLEDGTQVPLANIYLEKQADDSTAEEESQDPDSLSDQGMSTNKGALPMDKSAHPKSRKKTSARRNKLRQL